MLFRADINVPANTLESAPVTEILKIAHGIITWISVFFPAGCHKLAHCVILHHEHQIAPSTEKMDLAADEFPIEWNEYYESYQPPYELKIKLWNEDDTYAHKITVRVAVLPRKAIIALAIVDAIKSMLGMLSPKRIFTYFSRLSAASRMALTCFSLIPHIIIKYSFGGINSSTPP